MLARPIDVFGDGSFRYVEGNMGQNVNVHHFFLTKQDAPGCQNKLVISRLRQMMMHSMVHEVTLSQLLLDTIKQSLGSFLTLPSWWHDEENEVLSIVSATTQNDDEDGPSTLENPRRAVKAKREAVVEVRSRPPGSTILVNSDNSPCFNIVDVPVTWKQRDEYGGVEEIGRILRCVVFELPGLLTKDVRVLRRGEPLPLEVPGEDYVRVSRGTAEGSLVVELKVTTSAFPTSCLCEEPLPEAGKKHTASTRLTQYLMNQIMTRRAQMNALVHDEGTRPHLPNRSVKTVKFQREFVDRLWQNGAPIQVASCDGLLVVGCLLEKIPNDDELKRFEAGPSLPPSSK